jgi:hypothetical protein
MLRRMALVRTDVSEELSASFIIRMTRISELGTTLAVTSNRRTCHPEERGAVPPKHQFLPKPHGVTSQKTSFFAVTHSLFFTATSWQRFSAALDSRKSSVSATHLTAITNSDWTAKILLSHSRCTTVGHCVGWPAIDCTVAFYMQENMTLHVAVCLRNNFSLYACML